MFKWTCLAVAVVFLTLLGWLLNDIRLEVRRSAQVVHSAGDTVNEQLPAIVDRTRQTTDTVAESLPQIVQKVQTTTDTLAELAEDIRQLKEVAGVIHTPRDKTLPGYATSVLDFIAASDGRIGLKKTFGSGLKNGGVPAKDWVAGERKEAVFLTILCSDKAEFLMRLTRNKFHFDWYIQLDNKEPMKLQDWLKANHPGTRDLKGSARFTAPASGGC